MSKGEPNGMGLPKGITSSRPGYLWKIITILKEDGPSSWQEIMVRMKLRWRYYPTPNSLYTTLARRPDVFVLIDKENKKYDLKEEIRNAVD